MSLIVSTEYVPTLETIRRVKFYILGDGKLLWVLLLVGSPLPESSPLRDPLGLLSAISALCHRSRTCPWLLLTDWRRKSEVMIYSSVFHHFFRQGLQMIIKCLVRQIKQKRQEPLIYKANLITVHNTTEGVG